jgi:hypothetical protein
MSAGGGGSFTRPNGTATPGPVVGAVERTYLAHRAFWPAPSAGGWRPTDVAHSHRPAHVDNSCRADPTAPLRSYRGSSGADLAEPVRQSARLAASLTSTLLGPPDVGVILRRISLVSKRCDGYHAGSDWRFGRSTSSGSRSLAWPTGGDLRPAAGLGSRQGRGHSAARLPQRPSRALLLRPPGSAQCHAPRWSVRGAGGAGREHRRSSHLPPPALRDPGASAGHPRPGLLALRPAAGWPPCDHLPGAIAPRCGGTRRRGPRGAGQARGWWSPPAIRCWR